MEYTFSPVNDFGNLASAISNLYGQAAEGQTQRFQALLRGMEETFGPRGPVAVFSAPGRTEIGGNHTDHQHGKVLAGSVNLDVIAAVAPSGDHTIRIRSEGFPMDVVDLGDLAVREEERNTSAALIRGIAAWFVQHGCP